MTSHEIGLPRSPSTISEFDEKSEINIPVAERSSSPSLSLSLSEKSKSRIEDEHGEISSQYLTFETELPQSSTWHSSNPNDSSPLDCPSLQKYTNPFDWSPARKSFIICLSCLATCFTAFSSGAYAPGIDQMMAEWHISRVAALVGITIFTCGFAIAPMMLAPFSELNGRRPVFIASGALFVVTQMCCALTTSFGGMLVSRFFVGVGSSTFSTLVGGCVSDLYHKQDRNTPMALFSGAALFGTGLGVVCAGLIAQNDTWRWIFWMQLIMDGALIAAMALFFKETRGSVLLSRKARALNKWYEQLEQAGYYGLEMPTDSGKRKSMRIRWKVKSDEERGSFAQMMRVSLFRPFHLLFTEPVVFFFSLWVSFCWAVLYLFFSAISLVMIATYGFDIAQSSAAFTSICVGAIIFTFVTVYQEKWAIKYNIGAKWKSFPLDWACPEGRLYFSCVESLLLVVGMFVFGWTAVPYIHWIAPCVGVALATMGIFSIYLATFNYLADTYHRYASSALAAQSFCRNALGGAAPLFTAQMYNSMGYGGASSLLGGCALLLSLVPWILTLYGPRIRARSKFASEIMQ